MGFKLSGVGSKQIIESTWRDEVGGNDGKSTEYRVMFSNWSVSAAVETGPEGVDVFIGHNRVPCLGSMDELIAVLEEADARAAAGQMAMMETESTSETTEEPDPSPEGDGNEDDD